MIEDVRERRFRGIVNIASVNGQSGQAKHSDYAATKAGIMGFTKSNAAAEMTCDAGHQCRQLLVFADTAPSCKTSPAN